MRYLLLVIIACTPLAALTGWSFWQAVRGAAGSGDVSSPANTAEMVKQASARAGQAKLGSTFASQLAQADLLDAGGQPLDDPDEAKLKAVAEAWNHSRQARQLASKYAKAAAIHFSADAPSAERRREVQAAVSRLREFVSTERQSYEDLDGARELFATLERRIHQLEAEIDGYKRKDQMAAALVAANSDFQQGQYDDCLKRLNGDPLAGASDPDLVDELQKLRKRAEYRRAWEDLTGRNPGADGDRDLYTQIEAFLRRYPGPPTPAEGDMQTQIERSRDHLKSEMSVHLLDQARDLDTLLVEASQIVSDARIEASVKQQARHQVTEWLAKHLPKIEPPAFLLGKQEAVTKSGQRKIGIFFLPPGAEQFRFWAERRDRNDRPRGDEQFARGSFEQEPATPQYIVWAQQYNQSLETVLGEGAARSDWQQLADDCDTRQQQLAAYRERWGVDDEPDRSCREWSFRDAAGIARNVLKRWTQYETIAANSQ